MENHRNYLPVEAHHARQCVDSTADCHVHPLHPGHEHGGQQQQDQHRKKFYGAGNRNWQTRSPKEQMSTLEIKLLNNIDAEAALASGEVL